jgi:hypothetical protein
MRCRSAVRMNRALLAGTREQGARVRFNDRLPPLTRELVGVVLAAGCLQSALPLACNTCLGVGRTADYNRTTKEPPGVG